MASLRPTLTARLGNDEYSGRDTSDLWKGGDARWRELSQICLLRAFTKTVFIDLTVPLPTLLAADLHLLPFHFWLLPSY